MFGGTYSVGQRPCLRDLSGMPATRIDILSHIMCTTFCELEVSTSVSSKAAGFSRYTLSTFEHGRLMSRLTDDPRLQQSMMDSMTSWAWARNRCSKTLLQRDLERV